MRTGGSGEQSVRARSPVVSTLSSAPSSDVAFVGGGIVGTSYSGARVLWSSTRSSCFLVNQLGLPGLARWSERVKMARGPCPCHLGAGAPVRVRLLPRLSDEQALGLLNLEAELGERRREAGGSRAARLRAATREMARRVARHEAAAGEETQERGHGPSTSEIRFHVASAPRGSF